LTFAIFRSLACHVPSTRLLFSPPQRGTHLFFSPLFDFFSGWGIHWQQSIPGFDLGSSRGLFSGRPPFKGFSQNFPLSPPPFRYPLSLPLVQPRVCLNCHREPGPAPKPLPKDFRSQDYPKRPPFSLCLRSSPFRPVPPPQPFLLGTPLNGP